MLAPNFLSAEALGITEEQQEALIITLRAFESGSVGPDEFDMGDWLCCIGGWAEKLAENEELFSPPSAFPLELNKLFFQGVEDGYNPFGKSAPCTDTTKGAAALRNYLVTGQSRWDEVLQW